MIYVESLHRIILVHSLDEKAALLQQEFILPLGTALSQELMEAGSQKTNSPTVLQCQYTNRRCCKFRDK